jgi:hypothetical protein
MQKMYERCPLKIVPISRDRVLVSMEDSRPLFFAPSACDTIARTLDEFAAALRDNAVTDVTMGVMSHRRTVVAVVVADPEDDRLSLVIRDSKLKLTPWQAEFVAKALRLAARVARSGRNATGVTRARSQA